MDSHRQPISFVKRVVGRIHTQRSVFIFALVVMFVTTLPYFLGFESQGDEWRFTGFVFGVEDGNSYIGKMLRGAHGDWLFRTPYTAEDQRGVFAFNLYPHDC